MEFITKNAKISLVDVQRVRSMIRGIGYVRVVEDGDVEGEVVVVVRGAAQAALLLTR